MPGSGQLLTSTKKFYVVDPITNTLDQFLDPNDTTLAFYTYGAVQRGVLPVGLVYLQDTEEILLCYPTMGVFVDKKVGAPNRRIWLHFLTIFMSSCPGNS